MTTAIPLNSGLYRIHRILYIAMASFAAIMLLIGILSLVRGGEEAGVGFIGLGLLPIGVVHWYAAKGARDGKSYGKVLSRIIGTLWLVGFPIGTALGIYVWSQTGSKWKASVSSKSRQILRFRNQLRSSVNRPLRRHLFVSYGHGAEIGRCLLWRSEIPKVTG